jgi:hypothetical protein
MAPRQNAEDAAEEFDKASTRFGRQMFVPIRG